MPQRYLLACSCGKQVPVTVKQAGGSVRCECGNELKAPPLRKLRQLPSAPDESAEPTPDTWGARPGLLLACAVLLLIFLAGAAWTHFNAPDVPDFPADLHVQRMRAQIEHQSPAEAWQSWTHLYKPLDYYGFHQMQPADIQAIRRRQDAFRTYRDTLLALAALTLLAMVVLMLLPANRSGGRRPPRD